MLTLRRNPNRDSCDAESTIDIQYKEEVVTLSLREVYPHDKTPFSVWFVSATDWADERFPPKFIALTDNQPLVINSWLKIYGAKINDDGQAIIHLQASQEAIINRRDRT